MSDETVKQEEEPVSEVKKKRGRPRKQKPEVQKEGTQGGSESNEQQESAKKVFRISRTPRIKVRKKEDSVESSEVESIPEDKSQNAETSFAEEQGENQMELPLSEEAIGSERESLEEKAELPEAQEEVDESLPEAQDGRDEATEGRKKYDKYDRYNKNKKNGKKRSGGPS